MSSSGMVLTEREWRDLDRKELAEGYEDGFDGWPARQGAGRAYLWGHDTGRTDAGRQPDYTHNQRSFARIALRELAAG